MFLLAYAKATVTPSSMGNAINPTHMTYASFENGSKHPRTNLNMDIDRIFGSLISL